MLTTSDGKSYPRTPPSVSAVAVVQFIGSVILLIPASLFLFEDLQLYRLYPETYRALPPAVYVFYMVLPIGFALMGIIASIGLGYLREWARKCTLFLAVAPATVYVALLIIHPVSVFPRGGSGDGALLTVGGDLYFDVVAVFVCFLVPVSIWWLLFLASEEVRAQFRSGRSPGS